MSKSIGEISALFSATSLEEISPLLKAYEQDPRKGVQALVKRYEKKLVDLEEEKRRMHALLAYERTYQEQGYVVCGIDEAGRGPLAGPVVAGAVILPENTDLLYIDDSKKLSATKREMLFEQIKEEALSWAVGIVSPARIDEINILQATYEAMRIAIGKLTVTPTLLLNDAVTIPKVSIVQVPIIKGDQKSASIGAASIMAKVTRDRLMMEYDKVLPAYGFASHKGYGSKEHIEALKKEGPSPIHRRSFIHRFIQ